MTKAMATNQPMTTRQQATEADTMDERWKLSRQTTGASDQSPFSGRRAVPKSLDRASRRAYPSSPGLAATTDKDASLSKNPANRASITLTPPADNQKESWKSNALAELTQRFRRQTSSKSSGADPLTPVNKFLNKEDSPASASHSDPAKPRVATAVQNRSYQLRSSDQAIPPEGSSLGNAEENPSPAGIMFASTGTIEHGKPPKTPRMPRAATSRSDALATGRQMSSRAGDSEAMSIPAATFAIKAGPQTVMSQWIVSLDDEGSDDQHSGKWEDAQEKLQSTTHEPTQYHPAVSTPPPQSTASAAPPITTSQLPATTMPYNVILNSNSSGLGPIPTRPTTNNAENQRKSNARWKEPVAFIFTYFLAKDSSNVHSNEALPFENYRSQNNSYAGANRPSDDEVEEEDDEELNGPDKRRFNPVAAAFSSSRRPSNLSGTVMTMMIMSSAEPKKGVSKSSSSSSSGPIDEGKQHQQSSQTRRYNFVPAPFNGTSLLATEKTSISELNLLVCMPLLIIIIIIIFVITVRTITTVHR